MARRYGGALERGGLEHGDAVTHVRGRRDVGARREVALADEVADAGSADVGLVDVEDWIRVLSQSLSW